MLLAKPMSQPHEYSVNAEMTDTSNNLMLEREMHCSGCANDKVWRITAFSMSCLIYLFILSRYTFDFVAITIFMMW